MLIDYSLSMSLSKNLNEDKKLGNNLTNLKDLDK